MVYLLLIIKPSWRRSWQVEPKLQPTKKMLTASERLTAHAVLVNRARLMASLAALQTWATDHIGSILEARQQYGAKQ